VTGEYFEANALLCQIVHRIRRLSSSGTENLGKDFPSFSAKPAASIQASSTDNSPGRRNGRSSPRATNSGSVKA
jgi:hypothetical protein